MAWRILRLLLDGQESAVYVTQSYDRIGTGYDDAWTNHMRDLTESLINRLRIPQGASVLDLACGTGFATGLLAEHANGPALGVDRSSGMLQVAAENCPNCEFIQSDMLDYLKKQPSESFDVITCCWALGYCRPFKVLRQISRILKPGGTIAIIDNSLFSLREALYASFLAFAEQPQKLTRLMKFRFLPGVGFLKLLMRLAGLKPLHSASGSRKYLVSSGRDAIERLRSTGAAAGFEFAAGGDDKELFDRFAKILEERYGTTQGVPIIHRYIEAIAYK